MQFNVIEEETIEQRVQETDVSQSALKIAAEQHEQAHIDRGESHHVTIREAKSALSKEETELVEQMKKKVQGSGEYKQMTVDQATGISGTYSQGESTSAYTHAGEAQASCTCRQWHETASGAMGKMLEEGEGKMKGTGIQYESKAGKIAYQTKPLEALATGYSAPGEGTYQ